jgi:hypothetical protein
VEGTVLLKVQAVDLMARVPTERIQVTAARAVLVADHLMSQRRSRGWEAMTSSAVVLEVESIMEACILLPDQVDNFRPGLSDLVGLVEKGTDLVNKDPKLAICARLDLCSQVKRLGLTQ